MAETTLYDGLMKFLSRGLTLADAVAIAAIAWMRRYVPENFGVDLAPPAYQAPGRSAAVSHSAAKLRAFTRSLLRTRLDRSSARIRTLALGLLVAYVAIGAKLVVLGLSHDPPQTLKGAADQAVSGARPDLLDRNEIGRAHV